MLDKEGRGHWHVNTVSLSHRPVAAVSSTLFWAGCEDLKFRPPIDCQDSRVQALTFSTLLLVDQLKVSTQVQQMHC